MKSFLKENRNPKVLMFAPYCYPPSSAEAIVASKFVMAAVRDGWQIDVVVRAGDIEWYPSGHNKIWLPLVPVVHHVTGPMFFSTKFNFFLARFGSIIWVIKAVLLGRKLIMSNGGYDVIISRATPQYGHLPAWILTRFTRVPWIANWSDPMPQNKAPKPYGHGSHGRISFVQRMYLSVIGRAATCHTFPCSRLLRYCASYIPGVMNRSFVIPHIALNQFRTNAAGSEPRFILCHTGSLTFRPPDVLFQAISKLTDKIGENIFLHFVGPDVRETLDKAEHYGIERLVTVEGSKMYEETQSVLSRASVLVVIEAQCEEGIFLPSKFADFVQTNRPILAISPVSGTLADVLSAHGGGIAADCSSVDKVALAVETMYLAWVDGTLEKKYQSGHLFGLYGEDVVMQKTIEVIQFAMSSDSHE